MDIVKIKALVKAGLIRFEILNGHLYCIDCENGERVRVQYKGNVDQDYAKAKWYYKKIGEAKNEGI